MQNQESEDLSLNKFRLEFLFRNERFGEIVAELDANQEEMSFLSRIFDSCCAEHGLSLYPEQVDDTAPHDLQAIKREYNKTWEHYYNVTDQLERLLKHLKIHYDIRYSQDLMADYSFYLHKGAKTTELREGVAEQKEYQWTKYMSGVKAVLWTRHGSLDNATRPDLEAATRVALEKKTHDRNEEKAGVDYLKTMLPVIVKNYEKFEWTDEPDMSEDLWSSAGVAQDGVVIEGMSFFKPAIYSRDTKSFFCLTELQWEGAVHQLAFITELKPLDDEGFLTMKIDITRGKEHLLSELRALIDYFKAIDDDLVSTRRTQLKLYGEYLKVHDLVQKKGKKWTEIARQVFPDDFIDTDAQQETDYYPDPERARIKVQQYYDKARKLIEEGLP